MWAQDGQTSVALQTDQVFHLRRFLLVFRYRVCVLF